MQLHSYRLFTLVIALLFVSPLATAGEAPENADRQLDHLIAALEDGNHEDFISNGNDAFQSNLSERMFDTVQEHLGGRMAEGVERSYLASLEQYGMEVHVWKLSFADGEDELIARLALDGNGEVGGVWFH